MDRIIRPNALSDRLSLLWIGLGLYTLAYAQTDIVMLGLMGSVFNHLVPIGVVLIFSSLFSSLRPSEIDRSRFSWTLAGLLIAWHIFMAFRLDPEDMLAWILYSDPYNYTVYLFALVMLIPPIPLTQSFFKYGRWLILVGMPLVLMPLLFYANNGAIQFCFEGYLAVGALLLMTNKYHKRQWLWVAFIGLLLAFIIATLKARRNLMATSMLYMLGAAYMMIFRDNKMSRSTQIFIVMIGISIVLIGAVIYILGSKGIFSSISERAGENTREYVFLLFFWDMLQTPLDMLIGRGIRGVYECPGVDENGETTRFVVENGYLHMLLKGGFIYVSIIVTTLITAIIKGLKGKNQICQASIIIIGVQLFDMLTYGLHAVSAKTFIIWMCVSLCLCPKICQMNDEEMLDELMIKKDKLPEWDKE